MVRIIALTGKMGSGKSTVMEMLSTKLSRRRQVYTSKFANPLYRMQNAIYEIIEEKIPHPKDRKLLQWLGTEWGRDKDVNLWVNIWKRDQGRWLEDSPTALIVTDDCRFNNEAEAVHEMGGKIIEIHANQDLRVERNALQISNEGHASEKGLDLKHIDFVIANNVGWEELSREVDRVIEELGL